MSRLLVVACVVAFVSAEADDMVGFNSILVTAAPTSFAPTAMPTEEPTVEPTVEPTFKPSSRPTEQLTMMPTVEPTSRPSSEPTVDPTKAPTYTPTARPTKDMGCCRPILGACDTGDHACDAYSTKCVTLDLSHSLTDLVYNPGVIVTCTCLDGFMPTAKMNKCKKCPKNGCPEMRMPISQPFHPQPAYEPQAALPNIYEKNIPVESETVELGKAAEEPAEDAAAEEGEEVVAEEVDAAKPAAVGVEDVVAAEVPVVTSELRADSEGVVRVGEEGNTSNFALIAASALVATVATVAAALLKRRSQESRCENGLPIAAGSANVSVESL